MIAVLGLNDAIKGGMPISLSTSRFAPPTDMLRTTQSIAEPTNEIVPAFMTFWRSVSRLSFITTALCYARARFGEAEVWRDLAHREIASRFQTTSRSNGHGSEYEGDYRN